MKKPWIILFALICLLGSTLALWRQPLTGAENTPPCLPGPKETNCIHEAILHISTNITMDPAAPPGAPYHSIVCVGQYITASSGGYTLVSNALQEVVQVYTGGSHCPTNRTFETNGPLTVQLGWTVWDDNDDFTNGVGTTTDPFTRTNGVAGSVTFNFHQIVMPTNSVCGAHVPEGHEAASKSFAFVEVASLEPSEGEEMLTNGLPMNPRTFKICQGTNVMFVTAASYPELEEQHIPDCWDLDGNRGYMVDKLKWAIDKTGWTSGSVSVSATANVSTKTINLILGCPCDTPLSNTEFAFLLLDHPKVSQCRLCKLGPATTNYNCLAYVTGETSTWVWTQADSLPGDGILTLQEVFDYFNSLDLPANDEIAIYGHDVDDIQHFAFKSGGNGPDCRAVSKPGSLPLIAHPLEDLEDDFYGSIVAWW